MTYSQHFKFALGLSGLLTQAAVTSLIHAVFPFLFETSTSDIIKIMSKKFEDLNKNT
jgi:hypothetical protein